MDKKPSSNSYTTSATKPFHHHLHLRFCSFVAALLCFWWAAYLLPFQTSVTHPSPHVAIQRSAATVQHFATPHITTHAWRGKDHKQIQLAKMSSSWSSVSPSKASSALSHLVPSSSSSSSPSTLAISSATSSSTKSTPTAPAPLLGKPSLSPSSAVPPSSLSSNGSSTFGLRSPLIKQSLAHATSPSPSLSLSSTSSSTSLSSSLNSSSKLDKHVSSSSHYLQNNVDLCSGKYVYIHSLPTMFNQDMITNCSHLTPNWTDFCSTTSNGGLGPILEDKEKVLTPPHNGIHSWFNTEQFIMDVLFHSRMKKYQCLTTNSSQAVLIYVPFYAGLDITRHLWGVNVSVRDYLPNALVDWLPKQPEWRSMGGRDHFLVTGKISWDFRRTTDDESDWGNKLLELPALQDVSVLLIEKGPAKASHVEHALPYPTYFHPYKDSEIFEWQGRMRALKRVNLFAFAGASRPEFAHSIRGELIEQCRNSTFCKLLECTRGQSGCNSPTTVMRLFQESTFCLQPSGDSYTRRSVFDAMVSGCIPVLFHPDTVYTQYNWHLPEGYNTYSVFIPEAGIKAGKTVLEKILGSIPQEKVKEMRETVIKLIPNLIYAHPDHKLEKVKDAFDVAMEALLKKVGAARQRIRERAEMLRDQTRTRRAASQ